jgi:hypothetical protein
LRDVPIGLGLVVAAPEALDAVVDVVGDVLEPRDGARADDGARGVGEEGTEPDDAVNGDPERENRGREEDREGEEDPALPASRAGGLLVRAAHVLENIMSLGLSARNSPSGISPCARAARRADPLAQGEPVLAIARRSGPGRQTRPDTPGL